MMMSKQKMLKIMGDVRGFIMGRKVLYFTEIDNSMTVYEVSENGTEREHWEVFHASPYCDMQWLYDWINMVESEES